MTLIFHIRMTERGRKYFNFDSYSDFVVIAETEEEARKLCKCADECKHYNNEKSVNCIPESDKPEHKPFCFWNNKELTEAIIIGKSDLNSQLICKSFNAG